MGQTVLGKHQNVNPKMRQTDAKEYTRKKPEEAVVKPPNRGASTSLNTTSMPAKKPRISPVTMILKSFSPDIARNIAAFLTFSDRP